MARRLIGSGSALEALAGYSRAVVDGDWVFVSGTTGMDYATGALEQGAAAQTERAIANIEAALARAGASLADILKLTVYVADSADFETVAAAVGRAFRDIRPANTTVCARLFRPEMRVEIECLARRGSAAADGEGGRPPSETE